MSRFWEFALTALCVAGAIAVPVAVYITSRHNIWWTLAAVVVVLLYCWISSQPGFLDSIP